MIYDTEHIIGKQHYQITTEDEKNAHHYQSSISVLQETRINELFEKIFNKYSHAQSIFQFNQIELDLGSIPSNNFDDDLLFRLEEELHQFFLANIKANGELRIGKIVPLQNHKLQQLEHFLINGFLKWSSASKDSPQKIINELLLEDPEDLTALLMRLGKKQDIRKRMILQFKEKTLEKLVGHVAKTEGQYIITYKQNILDHHHKTRFIDTSFSTFRNAVWEVILAYLFESSDSFYNKKNFLHLLIQKIALKYNLTYKTLLDIISQGIQLEEDTTQIPEFRKLIIELVTENTTKTTSVKNNTPSVTGINDTIDQLDLFILPKGSANSNFFFTKAEFKTQLESILTSSNKISQFHISKWLKNKRSRERLFSIVTPFTLTQLLIIGINKEYREIEAFFNAIEAKKQHLSTQSKQFLQKIIAIKPALLFLSIPNFKVNQVILPFLEITKKEIVFKDHLLFLLLSEIRPHLTSNFQEIIGRFFTANPKHVRIQLDTNQKKQLIIQLSRKLQQQFSSLQRTEWTSWLHAEISRSSKETKCPPNEILLLLKQVMREHFAAPEYLSFIAQEEAHLLSKANSNFQDLRKSLSVPSMLIDLLITEIHKISLYPNTKWGTDVIALIRSISTRYKISFVALFQDLISHIRHTKNNPLLQAFQVLSSSDRYLETVKTMALNQLNTHSKNNVFYILKMRNWPWWDSNYRTTEFNQDFQKLWNIPSEQKEILKTLHKNAPLLDGNTFLNSENTYAIWIKLDQSPQKDHSKFLIEIHKLLRQNFVPIASISKLDFTQFNHLSFRFLLDKRNTSTPILLFFETWINTQLLLHNNTTRRLWINTLKTIGNTCTSAIKKQIQQWIDSLETQTLSANPVHPKIVQLFLKNHLLESNISLRENTFTQLEQIALQQPLIFSNWLQQMAFRKDLAHQLSHTDIQTLIHGKLDSVQQQFYINSIKIIDAVKTNLTESVGVLLYPSFHERILQAIGEDQIKNWGVQQWSEILFLVIRKITLTPKGGGLLKEIIKKEVGNVDLILIQKTLQWFGAGSVKQSSQKPLKFMTSKEYFTFFKIQIQKGENFTQLISDVLSHQKQLLSDTSFRKEIIGSIPEKDLIKSIKKNLSTTQVTYFEIVRKIISRMHFSITEMKLIKTSFYQLLLLKIGTSGFTSWTLHNWVKLFTYGLEATLDKVTIKAFLVSEKENILLSNSPTTQEVEFLQLMEQELVPHEIIYDEEEAELETDYQKLGEKEKREYVDPMYINHSGLILLAPYLGMLFDKCGLTTNNVFIDTTSQSRAVHLLEYAATGKIGLEEHDLTINKILCGMQISDPIASLSDISSQEKEVIDSLLHAVTKQWTPLKNTSIQGLRTSFLERAGKLEEEQDAYFLKVEQMAFDMLLDQISWNITKIKLSWMHKILLVEWR